MIDRVYLYSHGEVMCFDEGGRHLPEFQGRFLDVRKKVLDSCTENTTFWFISSWTSARMFKGDFASEGWNPTSTPVRVPPLRIAELPDSYENL